MMLNSTHQDDLDLLLSLQDRVLDTPPGSPSSSLHPPSPDDELPRGHRMRQPDMSVFRSAVEDILDDEFEQKTEETHKPKLSKKSNDVNAEKFSGLRIRDQVVSSAELSNRFSDIRFIQLSAIKNLLMGDTLSGCWATVGVLTEKGSPKTSSNGKKYCIWKTSCLDENTVSIFLFNEAYQKNQKEAAGTVFALFNCAVRKDTSGLGYSLNAYSADQMLKIGIAIDYGVCKGKRKDGMACTLVINKRHGIYCTYHKSKSSEKYTVTRNELKGGNLRTGFRQSYTPYKPDGVYMVDPLAGRTNVRNNKQPIKLQSVEGLKKALSNAGKVTSNTHSQGIRFLTEITGKLSPKAVNKTASLPNKQTTSNSEKRPSSNMKVDAKTVSSTIQTGHNKKIKTEHGQAPSMKTKQATEKMIELEYISSDEEL